MQKKTLQGIKKLHVRRVMSVKIICKTKSTQKISNKLERKEKQRSLENLEETHTGFSFFPPMFCGSLAIT